MHEQRNKLKFDLQSRKAHTVDKNPRLLDISAEQKEDGT